MFVNHNLVSRHVSKYLHERETPFRVRPHTSTQMTALVHVNSNTNLVHSRAPDDAAPSSSSSSWDKNRKCSQLNPLFRNCCPEMIANLSRTNRPTFTIRCDAMGAPPLAAKRFLDPSEVIQSPKKVTGSPNQSSSSSIIWRPAGTRDHRRSRYQLLL